MHTNQLFSLEKRCALVIGGAGKIAYPMAEALAEAGARVYIGSRTEETCQTAAKRLREQGLRDVHAIVIDQADETSVKACLSDISSAYKCPDILVNSGVIRPMTNLFEDSVESWDRSMEVNSRGIFITCRTFGKAMSENGGGSIINVASIYGVVAPDPSIYEGTTLQTPPDYPFTKGGMIAFSQYLASYMAKDKVRVNCIAPGGMFNNHTEPFLSQYLKKVPLKRMAYHDDLKGVTVFLASEASSYITGAVIPLDGGWTIM